MEYCVVSLGAAGRVAGDLTIDFCKKRSDGSDVSSVGFTLGELGAGDYLFGLSVDQDTFFRTHVTAAPEFYDSGVLERKWIWQGAVDSRVMIFLGPGVTGKVSGDMTFDYCKKVSDLSNVTTTGFFWYELGNGWYIIGLSVTEDVAFRIHVAGVDAQYDSGIFSPADKDITASTANIRQQILDAVKVRLQTITIANGYRTDLGLNVEEWDPHPLDPDLETLQIEYRDEAGTTGYAAVGEHLHTLPVTFRIRCQNNTAGTALSNLRKACADLYECIYNDVTFGGLAQDTNIGELREDYGENADRAAGAEVRYVIEYTTTPGSP